MKKSVRVHDKRFNRRSYQAINVANDVINAVKQGKKVNLRDIQVRNGYSVKSAESYKALETKSYQQAISSVVEQLEAVRAKTLQALLKKDHTKEKYRDLTDGLDKFTKNHQLLSGKATENTAQNIVVYGTDDWLATQKMKEGGV